MIEYKLWMQPTSEVWEKLWDNVNQMLVNNLEGSMKQDDWEN